MKELLDIYRTKKKEIEQRLNEFKEIRTRWDKDQLYIELCFCLLTPQSKARNAWKAITELVENNKLFVASAEEIAEHLNIVRFKNNKSRYIVELRKKFFFEQRNEIISVLESNKTIVTKRRFLVDNVKGIGYKEASHYLRNIGFYQNVSILDRHILRVLVQANILEVMPKSITKSNYLEIEQKMKKFSDQLNIPLSYLDFVIWYNQTKDIFK